MTEAIETLPAVAERSLVQSTVALPISVEEAVEQWHQYQQLTRALLEDSDYQAIGQKKFKKKSAWRKYSRAFNISDRVTHEEIVRGPDGFPVFARVRVQASHPSGRTAEADHECHVSERCCPVAFGGRCPKAGWRGHTCCTAGCNARLHWSHPGDIPATATTRAKNRAISDLIGAGEVSAEEMDPEREAESKETAAPRSQPTPTTRTVAAHDPATGAVVSATVPVRTVEPATDFEAVIGTIEKISEKDGTRNGKKWVRTGICIDGEWFNTFDTALADIAHRAKDEGETVRLAYTVNAKGYKDATGIEVLSGDIEPEPPPAEEEDKIPF
jgi:hypothetical protein